VETLRSPTDWFAVDNASVAGSVRRAVIRLAQRLGFGEHRVAEAGIVASEIAGNLWSHARNGSVAVQVVLDRGVAGVRIVAIDSGPGMADLPLSATDGHSTSGTLGVGLGAIGRLSTAVDVSSHPGKGTVLVADLWARPPAEPRPLDAGALTRPMAGEQECGDAVAGRDLDGQHMFLLSDGLGHGPLAAAASAEAVQTFHESTSTDPGEVLAAMHRRLARTRGAAVGVATIDAPFETVTFAGVGNVSAFVVEAEARRALLSRPGIVGSQWPKLHAARVDISREGLVILHSDGLRDAWNLRDVPGLFRRTSAVVAGAVLREAGTRPDDASVLVARRPR
jgi:anti-sigma regulatory factor (Ser/Thr protein kinase)